MRDLQSRSPWTLCLVCGGHLVVGWALMSLTQQRSPGALQALVQAERRSITVMLHPPQGSSHGLSHDSAPGPWALSATPQQPTAAPPSSAAVVPTQTVATLAAPFTDTSAQVQLNAPPAGAIAPPPPLSPIGRERVLPGPFASAIGESAATVTARADHRQCTPAAHPAVLRERGIEGAVTLRVKVDTQGRPADVQVLTGSGWRLFDEAALQQARGCQFFPATKDGSAIDSWVEFPVRFALTG